MLLKKMSIARPFTKTYYHRAPSTEDAADVLDTSERRSPHRKRLRGAAFILINIVFLAMNLGFFVLIYKHRNSKTPEIDFVIPQLQRVLNHEVEMTDVGIGQTSPYAQDTPEADRLWREISQDGPYGWIKVDKADLDRINQTSVRLEDGSGYLAGLEVYHELHCLNWFRRKILGREIKLQEDPTPEYHLGHCLDILRHSIQCHADLSLMPVRWVEGYPFPWPVFQTTRTCRNWDDIFAWTKEHSIGAAGRVVHPHLGPVDGKDFDPETLPRPGHIVYIDEE